jgi:outer membrane protein assembly factor BamB
MLTAGCAHLKSTEKLSYDKVWVRSTLSKTFYGNRRIHRFTPIVTDDLIIVGNGIDGLVAFDRKAITERWRFHIQDGVESGAFLSDGVLYFGAGDGMFYALNAADGRMFWSYPLKAEGIGKPTVSGNTVYVLGGNNIAHALDAKTGKLLWTYNRREASNLSIRGGSQPAVSGNLVYFGFSDGSLVALNRTSGNLVWEANLNPNKRFRDVDAAPIIDGDVIYISSYDGKVFSVNKQDGKINWSVDEGGYESVLLAGRTLFLSSTSGKILAIDKNSGKVIWSRVNPKGIATGAALWRGVLAFGEMNGALRFLDGRTGEFLGSFDPGRGVTSRPYVDIKNDEVFFMSSEANLYALKLSWQPEIRRWAWEKYE